MEVKDYSENYGEGWIKLYRSINKHWIWQDKPFTKGQAWIDMILECNHSDHKVNIGNELIRCNRGESLYSLDTWAKRWGWHKSRVRRFLELLKKDSMIDLKSEHNTTHLIILNYNTYQGSRNTNRTPIERSRNTSETLPTPNNKDKNVNKEKNDNKYSERFEEFWSAYPKKIGKGGAYRRWLQLKCEKNGLFEILMSGLNKQLPSMLKKEIRFVPHPETWLNQKRWDDDVIEETKKSVAQQIEDWYKDESKNMD